MNKLFTLIGCAAAMLPFVAAAQPNSVELKAGTTSMGAFNSIQSAYNAIPGTISQPYTVMILDNYTGATESFPVNLGNKIGASSVNNISISNSGNTPQTVNCNLATTDAFVFDNAHWVTLKSVPASNGYPTFRINGTGTSQSHYIVSIKNGSDNNTISYLDMGGLTSGTASSVFLSTGGNADNTLDHNVITGPTGVLSNGTPNNTNTGLKIQSNLIVGYAKAGVYLNQGAGKVQIDSNVIVGTGNYPNTESYGILHQGANDSLMITRNMIGVSSVKLGAVTRGIQVIASVPLSPVNPYTLLANNMVLAERGGIVVMGDTTYHTADSMSNLVGVELLGAASIRTDVINNTIKLTGNMNGLTITNGYSAAFQNSSSSPSSPVTIVNNVFVNERNTGSAASENVLVSYATNSSIVISDYNTYNSVTGILAKISGTNYATLTTLRTALAGNNETQANLYPVAFLDEGDLHLNRSAFGNPNLAGMPMPMVRDDRDGQMRGMYTRGADEFLPTCVGVSTHSTITASTAATICMNDYVDLKANVTVPAVNGAVYQWQSRPLGSSVPFTNIATAGNKLRLIHRPTGNTEYRFVDSCLVRPGAGISDTFGVIVNPLPDITGIKVSNSGLTFDFAPIGNVADINPLTYHWNFGDSRTSGTDSPSHTYTTEGDYDVELYVVGICGTDTFRTTISALAVNDVKTGKLAVYPNPATNRFVLECSNLPAGEQVHITITSMLGANVYRQSFRNGSTLLKRDVDMSGYTPGVYNVEVRSGSVVYRGNIVLQ
ncbi:MAG: PKD domain-containing protein [Sphingobacteriales bacterium]|nr:MAG: PKD domain-containing protein [Sphingobacteriales bacterium]